MTRSFFLLDRTAVLFLGVAAGAAIGYAFATGGERESQSVVAAPEAAPIQDAPPAAAPPPTTAPAARPQAGVVADVPAEVALADRTRAYDKQILGTVEQAGTIRVGVFGDSFGDGVWSALYRLLPAKDGYQVVKYSQQSTGFTRYKRLNLEAHDEEQIASDPVDVAVISFGANDVQGVYDGKYGALMSPHWQDVIGARIESYVAMLRRHGAMVYWVGLPKMRDGGFDKDVAAMNGFYAERMRRLGVPFIDIRPMTMAEDGSYQSHYRDADSGEPRLFRANDGIHMSMNGYVRITKGLASRIRSYVDGAKAQARAEGGQPS